jgi:hypothetical protein
MEMEDQSEGARQVGVVNKARPAVLGFRKCQNCAASFNSIQSHRTTVAGHWLICFKEATCFQHH